MFLQTNDRIINLKNVSNINILAERKRIVFNLNYNIEITPTSKSKLISDYVYWDSINQEDLQQNIKYIESNDYFTGNFLKQLNDQGFININEISSVKFSDKKYRVIFNLAHPVTFRDFDKRERITSEFVYVNCQDVMSYTNYSNYVKASLGIL